jgi:hypothetical protein
MLISLNSPKRPAPIHNNPAPMQGERQIFVAFSAFLFWHEKKEAAGAFYHYGPPRAAVADDQRHADKMNRRTI